MASERKITPDKNYFFFFFFSSEIFSSVKQQGYFMYEPEFYDAVKNLSDFKLRLIP